MALISFICCSYSQSCVEWSNQRFDVFTTLSKRAWVCVCVCVFSIYWFTEPNFLSKVVLVSRPQKEIQVVAVRQWYKRTASNPCKAFHVDPGVCPLTALKLHQVYFNSLFIIVCTVDMDDRQFHSQLLHLHCWAAPSKLDKHIVDLPLLVFTFVYWNHKSLFFCDCFIIHILSSFCHVTTATQNQVWQWLVQLWNKPYKLYFSLNSSFEVTVMWAL